MQFGVLCGQTGRMLLEGSLMVEVVLLAQNEIYWSKKIVTL